MTYVSASSENAQARFAGNWLMENDRYKAGKKTAIVMCDENILLPLMHSLPEDINKVNITSGYPLATTPIFSWHEAERTKLRHVTSQQGDGTSVRRNGNGKRC